MSPVRHRFNFNFLRYGAAALLAFALASCGSQSVVVDRKAAKADPLSTKQVPDFELQIFDAAGKLQKVKLSDAVKDKVVVMDFWATWCGPCKQEIPHLVALQDEYRGKGVEVIGLSVEDFRTDKDKVYNFSKEYKINYQVGFSSQEMFGVFNGDDPRGVIPQTFIFGRDGKLLRHIRGSSPKIALMIKEHVDKALETPAKTS